MLKIINNLIDIFNYLIILIKRISIVQNLLGFSLLVNANYNNNYSSIDVI